MDVTPLVREGQQIIQSYAAGVFRISGVNFDHAVLVFPEQTIKWNACDDFKELSEQHFQQLIDIADEIDVVLLGTGATMQFFNPELKQALSQKGLPIDSMDTGAACRTYNVLMAEGRRVVSALMPSK